MTDYIERAQRMVARWAGIRKPAGRSLERLPVRKITTRAKRTWWWPISLWLLQLVLRLLARLWFETAINRLSLLIHRWVVSQGSTDDYVEPARTVRLPKHVSCHRH